MQQLITFNLLTHGRRTSGRSWSYLWPRGKVLNHERRGNVEAQKMNDMTAMSWDMTVEVSTHHMSEGGKREWWLFPMKCTALFLGLGRQLFAMVRITQNNVHQIVGIIWCLLYLMLASTVISCTQPADMKALTNKTKGMHTHPKCSSKLWYLFKPAGNPNRPSSNPWGSTVLRSLCLVSVYRPNTHWKHWKWQLIYTGDKLGSLKGPPVSAKLQFCTYNAAWYSTTTPDSPPPHRRRAKSRPPRSLHREPFPGFGRPLNKRRGFLKWLNLTTTRIPDPNSLTPPENTVHSLTRLNKLFAHDFPSVTNFI